MDYRILAEELAENFVKENLAGTTELVDMVKYAFKMGFCDGYLKANETHQQIMERIMENESQ